MIANSVPYDIVFIIHVAAAIGTIMVFVTMRFGAQAVARGADAETQARRFPQRRNWAARLLHVLPITGLIMSGSGSSSVSMGKPWIIVGLVCYVAAAGHLEARTLPQERVLAATIARDGVASPKLGRSMVASMDILLAIVAIAVVSMVVQF